MAKKKKEEMTLEQQFVTAIREFEGQVQPLAKAVEEAIKALEEAAEKEGLPVNCDINGRGFTYIPASLVKKSSKWDPMIEKIQGMEDIPDEILELDYFLITNYDQFLEHQGWISSSDTC